MSGYQVMILQGQWKEHCVYRDYMPYWGVHEGPEG